MFNELKQIKVASFNEGKDFVELVEKEDYFFAVELQFDVCHYEVYCVWGPFEYCIVLVDRNALIIESKNETIPGEPTFL